MKIIGFFAIGLVAVLSSCGSSNQENQEQTVEQVGNAVIHITKKQFEASELQLGGLTTQTFQEVIVTNGRLVASPESKANVSSFFAGSVKEVKLQIGQKVEKGQVLFVLEHPDFIQLQQDFLEASGRLLAVKADYERQKNLAAEQVSSQKNFQLAESEYKVLEVRIKAMAKKLTLMGINPNTLTQNDIKSTIAVKAPISGYVTSLNLFLGAYLNPGETALTIIDTEDLQVELQIFEQDIHQIQIGQKVIFHLQNPPEQSFEGTISAVNRSVDSQTKSYSVFGKIAEMDGAMLVYPGMYLEAKIQMGTEMKLTLPEVAVVELEDGFYVLQLEKIDKNGYQFRKKSIEIGASNGDYLEVLNTQDFKKTAQFLIKDVFALLQE